MTGPGERTARSLPGAVLGFTVVLAGVAVAVGVPAHRLWMGPTATPLQVTMLAVMMVVAGTLQLSFHFRDDSDALDLFEVVLAVLLVAVPALAVIAVVGVTKAVSQALRRVQPVKAVFNVTQWMAAAALGSWVFSALREGTRFDAHNMLALAVALAVVVVFSHLTVTIVISLAQHRSLGTVVHDLAPVMVFGWLAGGAVNIAMGVLLAAGWTTVPAATLLFLAPLVALYGVSRAFVEGRERSAFLAGINRAARTVAASPSPHAVMPAFLDETRRCVGASAAELVLVGGDRMARWLCTGGDPVVEWGAELSPLASALLPAGSVRLSVAKPGDQAPLTDALAAAGWRSAVAVPVHTATRQSGVLCVYDHGFGDFEDGHIAVLEAMASELASALRRGELFEEVRAERAKLADIIDSTSDGILTIDRTGRVTSCNTAFEGLSGHDASRILHAGLGEIEARDGAGRPVRLAEWAETGDLPADFVLHRPDGTERLLSCSYSVSAGGEQLIVVARDVTEARQIAVQRKVIRELERAVLPDAPSVDGTELGLYFVCADDDAPTGGDLYDWLVLPDGDLHVAVIDVVGHGVAATKGALAIAHTVRLLALEGVPLGDIVARADRHLGSISPDLQATLVVARFRPSTGAVTVAGGGHPPAVRVGATGATELLAAPGVPLGWPGAGSQKLARAVLEPGDSLVLYTDGVIEAGRDILAGLALLERSAGEEAASPAGAMARTLVERGLEIGERRDDALALVVRRTLVTTPAGHAGGTDTDPEQAPKLVG